MTLVSLDIYQSHIYTGRFRLLDDTGASLPTYASDSHTEILGTLHCTQCCGGALD